MNTVFASAFIIAFVGFAACIGLGWVAAKYVESCARQPELLNPLRNNTLVLTGLIEAVYLIAVAMAFMFK